MPSGQDAPLGVVEFKEVQVRAIDPKTLAAVRASRRYIFRLRNQSFADKFISDCREGASISTLNLSSSSVGMTSPSGAAHDAAESTGSAAQQSDNSFMSML
jgi:hypothetical protein